MVDTHIHFDLEPFCYHEEEYLKRADESGVKAMITLGIDLVTSNKAVALARRYPTIYAGIGLHPTEAIGTNITTTEAFRALADREKVVAIGEVGLDYYRLPEDEKEAESVKREQQVVFEQFCSLAVDLSLPIITHARAAVLEAVAITRHYATAVPVIFHSFDGGKKEMKAIIEMGGYIGLNNLIGYPKNDQLREVIKGIPLNRILLETDAPYLPPPERRGEKSTPADVRRVAEILADITGRSVDVIERATDTTVRQIFKLALR